MEPTSLIPVLNKFITNLFSKGEKRKQIEDDIRVFLYNIRQAIEIASFSKENKHIQILGKEHDKLHEFRYVNTRYISKNKEIKHLLSLLMTFMTKKTDSIREENAFGTRNLDYVRYYTEIVNILDNEFK